MEGSGEMNNSSNPVFRTIEETGVATNSATYLGITLKTGSLLLVAILAAFGANILLQNNVDALVSILAVSGIVAFIAVLLGIFIPRLAGPFSILYSAAQGFTLGTLTLILETVLPGIGIMAVTATLVIFGVMLALYSSRTIRATNKMKKFMYGTILGILAFSLIMLIFSFISPSITASIASNTPLMILVSLFLIAYGAFMLILDFDRAEQIVQSGADKKYEWSVALGLMVTIIWIYIEVIRLLVLLMNRSN